MSGEVHRDRTTSGQVHVSITNPESKANYLYDLRLKSLGG